MFLENELSAPQQRRMDARMIRVGLFFVLLCVCTESSPDQGRTRRPPTRNAEQFPVDPAEIFKFFSATQPSGQQGGSVGATGTESPMCKSVIQQIKPLNPVQTAEIEQRTRNDPDQLRAEMRLRLTPDIFGPICLEKTTTPEALSTWLMSKRPRTDLWTNKRVVKALQAEIKKKMKPSGLIVDKTRGYLAAVPDGLVGDKAVVKVHLTELLRKDLNSKNVIDDELSPQKFLCYEIQGLLVIADKEECILVTVSKEMIKHFVVKRDRDFWNNKMANKIEQFSVNIFLPELIIRSSGRRPNIFLFQEEQQEGSLRETAKELLTCNVCSELIKPPYKVCRNGHLLCHSCWPQLQRANGDAFPKCPTCRVPIPPKPSRCLPLETLCNFIDPDMSPTPVIKPNDPMDGSSSPSSPLPQIQRNSGQVALPDLTTPFFPSTPSTGGGQQRFTFGEAGRDLFFERPRTTLFPQTERGVASLGSDNPFIRPALMLHHADDPIDSRLSSLQFPQEIRGRVGPPDFTAHVFESIQRPAPGGGQVRFIYREEGTEPLFERARTLQSPQTERGWSRLRSPQPIRRLLQRLRRSITRGGGRSTSAEEDLDSLFERPVMPPSPESESDLGSSPPNPFSQPFLQRHPRSVGVDPGRNTLWASYSQSHTFGPDSNARIHFASSTGSNDD